MKQIDEAHRRLIAGLVTAYKPKRVLELGIGTGLTTQAVLRSLQFNNLGTITCVDNYVDWDGEQPYEIQNVSELGAEVIFSDETAFIRRCLADTFDMLISDADHQHAHENVSDYCRIVKHDGIMIFHDVTNSDYPNLRMIMGQLGRCQHLLFCASSRPDERCERGLYIAINRKI